MGNERGLSYTCMKSLWLIKFCYGTWRGKLIFLCRLYVNVLHLVLSNFDHILSSHTYLVNFMNEQIPFFSLKYQLHSVCPAIFYLVWWGYILERWITFLMTAVKPCLRLSKLFVPQQLICHLKSPLHLTIPSPYLRLLILMILNYQIMTFFKG